jgi:Cysteine rich repeat
MRFVLFVGLTLVVGYSASFAQDFTPEQRAACKGDYDKFCKGTLPGGGRVLACLNKQHDQLSDACKKVVDAQRK